MMLAVEIEFLTGVARAANDHGDGPDWPPQPDRLFSALVATWAARGMRSDERAALEWLERARAPVVAASPARARTVTKVYVPPNDDAGTALTALPARRSRKERHFPAAVPDDPVLRWLWAEEPDDVQFHALASLMRDTSRLGHSASLVRCRALRMAGQPMGTPARRIPYPGRLTELEQDFAAGRRPAPGESVALASAVSAPTPASVFGTEWIVFAHAGGWRPDALGAALWSKTLLKTVQAGYKPAAAPAWVSGHESGGAPLAAAHLAAVPLLDAGWSWSAGRMMGIALCPPRALAAGSADEAALFAALGRINQARSEGLELELRLPGGRAWRVRREALADAASLRPERYCTVARLWASVTPIALDRHPKRDGDTEKTIATACERIGLPRPLRVVAGRHPAIHGAPAAWPDATAPGWTGWRRPPSLAGRRLAHALIAFDAPVAGPILLGAGRFAGLGLCLPLPDPPR